MGPLFGRDGELETLAGLREEHINRSGGLLVVEGSAGVGKTSLMAHHAHAANAAGIKVMWTRCTEIDRVRPFGGLVEVLDCRLQHPDASRRRVAEALVDSFVANHDPFRFEAEATWRFPVQEAIVDLVLEMVDESPLLLVFDDAPWADAGTLGVMQALARRCTTTRLAMAWTARTPSSNTVLDNITDRLADGGLTTITLPLLPVTTAIALGEWRLGRELTEPEIARISNAGGNPFLVKAAVGFTGSGVGAIDAVGDWLSSLPREARDLLGVAAVLGTTFDLQQLEVMTDRRGEEVIAPLSVAVERGLVELSSGRRYRFAHDLIRETLLETLPGSLRKALHRDAARALASVGADRAVVAHHLAHGARPGDEDAAEQIRLACEVLVRHDASSAGDLLARAIAICVPGSSVWAAAVTDRVVALQWEGRVQAALDLANTAIDQPMAPADLARVRMVRATSLGLANDLPASAAEYQLIAYDEQVEASTRAQILGELATVEVWGLDRAAGRERAHEALAMARSSGFLQAELQALCALSASDLFDGNVRDAVTHARTAATRGRGHPSLAPARELYLALALASADELAEAEIWLREGQGVADAVFDLWLVSRYQLARLTIGLDHGDWDAVVADAEAIIGLHADTGMVSGMPQAPATAGIISLRRGNDSEAVRRYRALATEHSTGGAEPAGLVYAFWLEALIAEADKKIDDGCAILEMLFASLTRTAPLVQLWVAPDFVRVLLAAGRADRAAELADALTVFAEHVGVGSARGVAALCRGLVLSRHEDRRAAPVLAAAAELLKKSARRPALLVASEELARISPSASLTAEIEELRRDLGIAAPLPADGARPVKRVESSLPGMTGAEKAVAHLVAEGLANQAIAEQLGVSKRTVEYHVSNLYMKLGVTTRTALAALMRSRSA